MTIETHAKIFPIFCAKTIDVSQQRVGIARINKLKDNVLACRYSQAQNYLYVSRKLFVSRTAPQNNQIYLRSGSAETGHLQAT